MTDYFFGAVGNAGRDISIGILVKKLEFILLAIASVITVFLFF